MIAADVRAPRKKGAAAIRPERGQFSDFGAITSVRFATVADAEVSPQISFPMSARNRDLRFLIGLSAVVASNERGFDGLGLVLDSISFEYPRRA